MWNIIGGQVSSQNTYKMKFLVRSCLFLLLAATTGTAQRYFEQQSRPNLTQIKEAERRLSELGYWTTDDLMKRRAQHLLLFRNLRVGHRREN